MQKRILLTLCILVLSLPLMSAVQGVSQRWSFDRDWQFRLCSDTAELHQVLRGLGITDLQSGSSPAVQQKTKVTDDTEPEQAQVTASEITSAAGLSAQTSDWREVLIPHDWSIELPFDPQMGGSAGYLAGGQGVYLKDFALTRTLSQAERIAIRFDGVYHRAMVWLNGHRLGHHVYGYTGFAFDLTPYLNRTGNNRLVVHVDREEQSRWYTGSGIYRHVWLESSRNTHIEWVNFNDGAPEAQIANGEGCRVEFSLLDASGKKVMALDMKSALDNKEAAHGSLANKLATLRRWDIDDPYLYILHTRVKDAKGRIVDERRTRVGIRDIRFDADSGFFLNGRNLKLKGMCLHQDAGSLGVAVPDQVWVRRLKALKEMGCNAIRCSHNPPSPEFLNICDSLGLMVLDEAFDKWKSGYYAPFYDDNAMQDISDMVIRDRNHPSVIVWSIGNEVSEAWKTDDEGVERARQLNDRVKALDPTRPTMVACQQGFQDKFGEVTDLVGYNYLEPRMIADHKRHPERKMLVSEAFVYYSGLREELVRDFVEENPWHFVEEHPFIAGSFVWAGVDYLGESSPWPAKGWCSCPMDMTLKERPQAAYYHPAWKPEEDYLKLVVRDNCFDQAMGTDHWQYPPMADTWDLPYKDSRCVQIRCYTTCDSVQFFFPMWTNPQLPLKTRRTADYPDHCITIQLPAREGKILAVGYKDGLPVMRDSLVNHGPVQDMQLECDHPVLSVQRSDMSPVQDDVAAPTLPDVAHIRISLVDSLGRLQQMEPRRFTVRTEGPIRLLGVETGDMRRQDSWRTTSLTTYFGEGLIRVQSTDQPGVGRVIVQCEGMEEKEVRCESVKALR